MGDGRETAANEVINFYKHRKRRRQKLIELNNAQNYTSDASGMLMADIKII
jgi:hypothetical protein